MLPQRRHDLRQPERPVHKIKVPSRLQKPLSRVRHVLKRAQHLVPGDRFGALGILQAVALYHVRGVARHHAKRSRREQRVCLPDISLHDPDPLLQPVEPHAPSRHFGAVRLDLQPCQNPAVRLGRHQQRDDPRPGAQIEQVFARHRAFPDAFLREPGQKHSIHAKTELSRILNDPQTAPLQVVDLLAGLQQQRIVSHLAGLQKYRIIKHLHPCHVSLWLLLFLRLLFRRSRRSAPL